jgi:hypothetical protein
VHNAQPVRDTRTTLAAPVGHRLHVRRWRVVDDEQTWHLAAPTLKSAVTNQIMLERPDVES